MQPRTQRSVALGLATALLTLAAPWPAAACVEAVTVATERVTISDANLPDNWREPTVRDAALWVRRLERLLPAGTTLAVEFGAVELCEDANADDVRCVDVSPAWRDGQWPTLFRIVAHALAASPEQMRRALAVRARPLTVEVASTADRAYADGLAARLLDALGAYPEAHGFVQLGGRPADLPVAHVLTAPDPHGGRLYRVVVGAFLDRVEADAVRLLVATEAGLAGRVKPL